LCCMLGFESAPAHSRIISSVRTHWNCGNYELVGRVDWQEHSNCCYDVGRKHNLSFVVHRTKQWDRDNSVHTYNSHVLD
jgi:hypothetical protein